MLFSDIITYLICCFLFFSGVVCWCGGWTLLDDLTFTASVERDIYYMIVGLILMLICKTLLANSGFDYQGESESDYLESPTTTIRRIKVIMHEEDDDRGSWKKSCSRCCHHYFNWKTVLFVYVRSFVSLTGAMLYW